MEIYIYFHQYEDELYNKNALSIINWRRSQTLNKYGKSKKKIPNNNKKKLIKNKNKRIYWNTGIYIYISLCCLKQNIWWANSFVKIALTTALHF